MSPDSDSSHLALDDLLNQADDLESSETQTDSANNQDTHIPRQPNQPAASKPAASQKSENLTNPPKQSSSPQSSPRPQSQTSVESGNFIRLACACGYRMRLKPNKAGERIQCPKCEVDLIVPGGKKTPKTGPQPVSNTPGFDKLWEKLTSALEQESEDPDQKKTLSGLAIRSLRRTVDRVSSGNYDIDRIREAIEQLGESGDSRAYPILEALWEEEPANLQSAILGAMGKLQDPRGTLFLLRLLKNPIPEIRLASVQSLALTTDPRVVKVLVHYGQIHPELKYAVGDSLLKMEGEIIDPVVELLQSQDTDVVSDAVVLLGRLKTADAVKPLMETFQTHPGPIQGQVAEAFGLIGDPKCIPTLVPLLKSPETKIRVQAASAMGRVPHPGCLKALIEALHDPNPEVKKRCAAALGEIGDKRASSALAKLLKESQTELRITVAEALGRIGDERAVPYLIDMTNDENESIVLKALGALRKLKSPGSIESLTGLLDHESSRVRQRTVDVLGQVGDAVIAEQLEQILKYDRSEDVRAAAAKALGEIRDPGSVDALIDSLHGAFTVRCRAIVALGEIGEEAALAPLLAMLKDPAPEIRYHASQALAQLKHDSSAKSIRPLLDDSNAMVRRGAAKALESLGEGDSEKLLGSSTQQGVRRTLHKVKGFLASISPGELADNIQHGSVATKIGAVAVLLLPVVAFGAYYIFSNTKTATEKVTLMRRGNTASLDISADGSRLVTGRTTGVVEIWDLQSKERATIFKPENLGGEILGAAFAPDGQSLVLVSGGKAGGFDPETGKMKWVVDVHDKRIKTFHASRDRKNFMLTDRSGLSSFWNATTGEPIGVGAVTLPQEFTEETQLSHDGSMITAGAKGSIVKIWSTKTVEELAIFEMTEKSAAISLVFSPDDSLLAISDSAGVIRIYDIETTQPVYQSEQPEASSLRPVLYQNLSFSEDGNQLQGMFGSQLFVLDIDAQEITLTDVPGLIPGVYGSQPGGSLFAIGSEEESEIEIFDRTAGKRKTKLRK